MEIEKTIENLKSLLRSLAVLLQDKQNEEIIHNNPILGVLIHKNDLLILGGGCPRQIRAGISLMLEKLKPVIEKIILAMAVDKCCPTKI